MDTFFSPNNQYKITYFDFFEPSMGACKCSFKLEGNDIQFREFPFCAICMPCKWSKDSQIFSVAIDQGFFLWNVSIKEFAVISVKNPYPLEGIFINERKFLIQLRDDQFDAANSQNTFGAGKAEWPVKRYRKPNPLEFNIDELSFYPEEKLGQTPSGNKYSLELIADGFHPFQGSMPQSTNQKLNGRQLEIFHLEAFAEYGDPLSQQWLEEIKNITGGKYSPWDTVQKHLGQRKR